MTTDNSILAFPHPDEVDDPLTSVFRQAARRLLAQAVEAEAEAFVAAMADDRLADGRARLVRHGHGPERTIQTGIGAVPVKRAKLRDRAAEVTMLFDGDDAGRNGTTGAVEVLAKTFYVRAPDVPDGFKSHKADEALLHTLLSPIESES